MDDKLLAVAGLASACSIQSFKVLQGLVEDKTQPIEVLNAARKAMYQTRKSLFGDTAAPEEA
jgi:serine phosphatase RsbU (regulator of sigma subunit)